MMTLPHDVESVQTLTSDCLLAGHRTSVSTFGLFFGTPFVSFQLQT